MLTLIAKQPSSPVVSCTRSTRLVSPTGPLYFCGIGRNARSGTGAAAPSGASPVVRVTDGANLFTYTSSFWIASPTAAMPSASSSRKRLRPRVCTPKLRHYPPNVRILSRAALRSIILAGKRMTAPQRVCRLQKQRKIGR